MSAIVVASYATYLNSGPVNIVWDGQHFTAHRGARNITGRMDAQEMADFVGRQMASPLLIVEASGAFPGSEVPLC